MAGERTVFSSESKVQIGLLIIIASAALTGTWQAARWVSALEDQISKVSARLERIEVGLDKDRANTWTRNDMAVWAQRLRELNEGVKVPVPLHTDD